MKLFIKKIRHYSGTFYKFLIVLSLCNCIAMSCENTDDLNPVQFNSPKNLQVIILSQDEVKLIWEDKSDNENGFYLERSDFYNDAFVQMAILGSDTEYYIDSTVNKSIQYYYRIRAFNSLSISEYSNEASVIVTDDLFIPQSPTALNATPLSSDSVFLTWIDNADNEESFEIQRSLSEDEGFSLINTVNPDISQFTDTDMEPDTTYYYRVRAINSFGPSGFSNIATVHTDDLPPNSPDNLSVDTQTDSSVTVSWNDNSTNESGFIIERSISDNEHFTELEHVESNIHIYTDMDVLCNNTYYYRTKAVNSYGESSYSNEISVTIVTEQPSAPIDVSISDSTSSSMTIIWNDTSNNEQGFRLEMQSPDSPFSEAAVLDADSASYTIYDLEADTLYTFRVRAFHECGHSDYSNEISGVTPELLPHSPADVAVSAIDTYIRLTWQDRSEVEEGFSVERRIEGDPDYVSVATLEANIEEYIDTDVEPCIYYHYRIRAYNSAGYSEYSNDASGQTGCVDVPSTSSDGTHPIFTAPLGAPVSSYSLGAIDPDPTGYSIEDDYDGDGLLNRDEIVTNEYVADYPRIVTRISTPLTIALRNDIEVLYSETFKSDDVNGTISNAMDTIQYNLLGQHPLSYISKDLYESQYHQLIDFNGHTTVSDYAYISPILLGGFFHEYIDIPFTDVPAILQKTTMSSQIHFEDTDYRDNVHPNSIGFKDEIVQTIVTNFRQNKPNIEMLSPNAGYVRAALYINNLSVNMPAHISNIFCTLSFKTHTGEYLPIKTFLLLNEDGTGFEASIYGNEELEPYTVELNNLSTHETSNALSKGYIPQIHIVSFDMNRIESSNYDPPVDNLKIIEETAKARTATISISGPNVREIYRVCAFDINSNGFFSPGISLKKALFNIFRQKTGPAESFDTDMNSNSPTVDYDISIWPSPDGYTFSENTSGNEWAQFATYVKSHRDANNNIHRVETIKRIQYLTKYNPFNTADNPEFDPNERLAQEELDKMGYWVILHNGRYFNGDINDPISAGERYEIIFCDINDFNEHFMDYAHSPILSGMPVNLDTRWNALTNQDELSRAVFLGSVTSYDTIQLEVTLSETRSLFGDSPVISSTPVSGEVDYMAWFNFNYRLEDTDMEPQGLPQEFGHTAEGGTNSITVNIEESENAQSYEITYCRTVDTIITQMCKTTSVSNDTLQEHEGTLIITSLSADSDSPSNTVGLIGAGDYDVSVTACGLSFEIPVTVASVNNNVTRALVYNADNAPGAFTFHAEGLRNRIDVWIQEASDTEYFLIDINGPANYGTDNFPDMIVGHSGLNTIIVPTPLCTDCDTADTPGLYSITVFALNNEQDLSANCNCLGAILQQRSTASDSGEQSVSVMYNPFQGLNPEQSIAMTYNEPPELSSVNLEINFNDGSGWFQLQVTDTDTGGPADRIIDCRGSSYIDTDSATFYINFKAPDGTNGLPDVFSDGRKLTDIHIRTSAQPLYRDTFWLKGKPEGAEYSEDLSCIYTLSDVSDFPDFWIHESNTDATHFMNTMGLLGAWTLDEPFPSEGGPFGIIDNGIRDYFFAPLMERKYSIKTIIR